MHFEMTIGLLVADHEKYAQYRAEIQTLLDAHGGRFRHDFEVARVLKSDAEHGINRLFVIQFPDRAQKERFFVDSQYVEIRARLFDEAVAGWTVIAGCDC
jgi:uncharacterized protein (DUF1330 family)